MSSASSRPGAEGAPTRSDQVPVRDDLVGVAPYGAPQLDVPLRLNTNEPPYPPPAAFDTALAARIAELQLHRYPDRDMTALRTALGARIGVGPERVWAASGSNEVLLHLFSAYGGPRRRLLLFAPGYSAHPLIARASATPVVTAALDDRAGLTPSAATAAVVQQQPSVVCIASPNAPTGVELDAVTVRALHDAFDGLLVLDGAYAEFARVDHRPLLDELPRLVWVRTFSKAWRLAGARLGYCYAPPWVVDDVRRVRLPYHLDALAQAAGLAALDVADQITSHVPEIIRERTRLEAALRDLGARTWPSGGNFLLFRVPGRSGRRLFDDLRRRGVLLRDFSAVAGLEESLRVTVGSPEENDAVVAALVDALAEPSEAAGARGGAAGPAGG